MAEIDNLYGLVGRNIEYSFSRKYFSDKFSTPEYIGNQYHNFDIVDIAQLQQIINENPKLRGFNVTIPFKSTIIDHIDQLSDTATEIGAVNTVKVTKSGKLKGYNTDWSGFLQSIEPFLHKHHKKALILGTGGASKAIAYALEHLKIDYQFVSRTRQQKAIGYDELTADIIAAHTIIINCTPIGTSPQFDAAPPIPYELLSPRHLAYDLIYNPEVTAFMKKASAQGATVKNGYEMLIHQAEHAWQIWQKPE